MAANDGVEWSQWGRMVRTMEVITEIPLEEEIPLGVPSMGQPQANAVVKSSKPLPPSQAPFDTKGYNSFKAKSLEEKRKYLRDQWLEVGYLSLGKARDTAKSITKKDYGRLVQILMAAGIAWDKVFPKGETVGSNLVLNIFNGLPRERVCNVIGAQPTPKGIALSSIQGEDDSLSKDP